MCEMIVKRRVPKSPVYADAMEAFGIMTVDGKVSDREALEYVAERFGFVAAADIAETVREVKQAR